MWQLLASETEVVIHSGFVYVPLLFDPHIKAELEFLAGKEALPPPGVIETIADKPDLHRRRLFHQIPVIGLFGGELPGGLSRGVRTGAVSVSVTRSFPMALPTSRH